MGEVYARSMSGQGYAAELQAILAANPRPSPRRGTIPPSAQIVLDQLAAYGTCDQVREQLQPWDHAADIVTILLPPGMPWPSIEATLLAAAPSARPLRPGACPPPQPVRPLLRWRPNILRWRRAQDNPEVALRCRRPVLHSVRLRRSRNERY